MKTLLQSIIVSGMNKSCAGGISSRIDSGLHGRIADSPRAGNTFLIRRFWRFAKTAACVGALTCRSAVAAVPSADITLQAPVQSNLPIFSPLVGYELVEGNITSDPNKDVPVYQPYDNWTDAWWDNLVAELEQARISNVMVATRGANDDPSVLTGGMNPRRLYKFVDAVNRAGLANHFKVSCFIDAPSAAITYNAFYGFSSSTLENMADNSPGVTDHWRNIWWLCFVKPWFDTVPQSMRHMENGHPRIEFWGLTSKTTNWEGNGSGLVNYISDQMLATYGVTPVFVGYCPDTTFSSNSHVIGKNPWFATPNKPFRVYTSPLTGYSAGTAVPGFIDPYYFVPGAANYQNNARVILRSGTDGLGQNGDTFRSALDQAYTSQCKFTLIEGWTNFFESAGLYRTLYSPRGTFDYPNQYINILRTYTDLRTVTLKLEAEGCDEFFDTTTGNSGGSFNRNEDLDVRSLVGTPASTCSSYLATYSARLGTDLNKSTKWVANGSLPQWLQYDYGAGRACAVNQYYVTSADNDPTRDPSAWTLLGSNDGTTWTTLDTRSGEVFTARKQGKAYAFTNSVAYRYYRLNVTAASGGPTYNLQVNDLFLKGGTATGAGWAVTNVDANEWIAFYGVFFSNGYYKFPIRYSSTAPHTVRMVIDGVALPNIVLPSTGSMDTFDTAYLGTKMLAHGQHDLRIEFVDGGVDVDWIFAKKADPMMSFKSSATGCMITAEGGGNSAFKSNVSPVNGGSFERFSANNLVEGSNGVLSNSDVVNFQSYNGYYLTAESSDGSAGGGGSLTANRRSPGAYEKFTLVKISGSAGNTIVAGDKIALRSNDGAHYLTVVNGTTVNVTGTSIGSGQTFTINLSQQQ